MSTRTATPHPAHHSALRRWVARHPVAAFLIMVYAVNIAVALPAVRTNLPSLPINLVLWSTLGHIFGSAVPAFLVIAAMHGRAGVRDLAQRCLRWRVGARWYLFALLGVPIGVLVCASAIYGLAPLTALMDKWLLLVTVIVPQLVLFIVFSNGPEEIGWMGFLQARLQEQHGPLKASLIVTLPFALYHLPGLMVDEGFGFTQLPLALGELGVIAILQLFGRVVMGWLYNNTHRSVLLVGMFHSAFDVTTQREFGTFIPGPAGTGTFIASGVVALAAVLIVIFTKGRLSYTPNGGVSQLSASPSPGQAGA
jgi:membrane protease YdiL (CAAX protease family)